MDTDMLVALLRGNRAHVEALGEDYFADVAGGQAPPVVSMCCSDSRVSQEGMFGVDEPGWLFSPSRIGNQAVAIVDGERVVDGSLLYPVRHTGTRVVAMVGHTGCGAVTAAYEQVQGEGGDLAPGIRREVELLVPVVEDALRRGSVQQRLPDAEVIDQLVEANVHAQVAFLLESREIPGDVDVYGFVYDLTGAYGGAKGRTFLVNANGERDVDALRGAVPEDATSQVASLLK